MRMTLWLRQYAPTIASWIPVVCCTCSLTEYLKLSSLDYSVIFGAHVLAYFSRFQTLWHWYCLKKVKRNIRCCVSYIIWKYHNIPIFYKNQQEEQTTKEVIQKCLNKSLKFQNIFAPGETFSFIITIISASNLQFFLLVYINYTQSSSHCQIWMKYDPVYSIKMKVWKLLPNATGIFAIFSSNFTRLLKSWLFRFCALAFKWNSMCPTGKWNICRTYYGLVYPF